MSLNRDQIRARIRAITRNRTDPDDVEIGSAEFWRGRRRAMSTRVDEQLTLLSNAIAHGGSATTELAVEAHRVVENLKDDIRLGRAAYARVQMGRVPRLLAMIECINDQVEGWAEVTQLSVDELLSVKGKLQSEIEHALRVADSVLDSPTPLAGRISKPVIDESSRDEIARRQVKQAFMLEIASILRKKAIQQGLLESPLAKLQEATVVEAEVVGDGRDHAGTDSEST